MTPQPHVLGGIGDPAEEPHQRVPPGGDVRRERRGGPIVDHVEVWHQHQAVALEIGTRRREVDRDVAPPQHAVRAPQRGIDVDLGRRQRLRLDPPLGVGVRQQRDVRVDDRAGRWLGDLAQACEQAAQPAHLART